jgi:hypothetical protein
MAIDGINGIMSYVFFIDDVLIVFSDVASVLA